MPILHHYSRLQEIPSRFRSLPAWARYIIALLALPGIILLLLSIVLAVVSILALLLLTVPAYRLLSALTAGGSDSPRTTAPIDPVPTGHARRHVDVRIVD